MRRHRRKTTKKVDTTVADVLKDAAVSYMIRKGFSCFTELGLCAWGRLRADVVSISLKGIVFVLEVKSSTTDFRTDGKWPKYLQYCHKFYFVMTVKTYDKLTRDELDNIKQQGAGVMILNPNTGYLSCKFGAAYRQVEDKLVRTLCLRMAWRNGISKRLRRRTRHFLPE